jgi:hypothetical protein
MFLKVSTFEENKKVDRLGHKEPLCLNGYAV